MWSIAFIHPKGQEPTQRAGGTVLCGGEPIFPAAPWKWEAPSPFPMSQPPLSLSQPPGAPGADAVAQQRGCNRDVKRQLGGVKALGAIWELLANNSSRTALSWLAAGSRHPLSEANLCLPVTGPAPKGCLSDPGSSSDALRRGPGVMGHGFAARAHFRCNKTFVQQWGHP